MIRASIAVFFMFFNLTVFFLFGSIPYTLHKKGSFSVTKAVFTGFFLYYLLFAFFCIPVMMLYRPLSLLTSVWVTAALTVCAFSALLLLLFILRKKKESPAVIGEKLRSEWIFLLIILAFTALEAFVIIYNYQFTLDAAYYVANVTTSLQTDMLNIYDPYTGNWQDHFEMRYFFAVFPLNDAVLCDITHIHPLVWCKTTMSGVAILLSNLVLYMTGEKLFKGNIKKTTLFIIFAGVMNFFFTTIFTPSVFLTTRTYEGKCLLANVVLPGIFYIYICILEDAKKRENWLLLLLVALGAPVLSSSSNMLIPAMIALTILPLSIIKKDVTIALKSFACMIPGIILVLVYVAYVKGMFVIHTYPG
ncbi:MAG: hypothetical protein IK139_05810 [Lachnospiraceae bacterium]|nr:hypothetical protein [Lachnospiraceae bacterium]